jgi:hypothetical protein
MKTKTVYWIKAKTKSGHDCSQYLLPKEFNMIKSMLKNGIVIDGVSKTQLSKEAFKDYFGI